jgi:NADH dehydrogenase FAD-containing subunit
MSKIVILGGGFAALSAAEGLASVANEHEITVVSSSEEFTFYPGVVPMIFGDLEARELRFDMRPPLGARNIRFLKARLEAVYPETKTVSISGAEQSYLEYDFLVVALGRRLDLTSIPGLKEHAHQLIPMESALAFRDSVAAFDEGSIVVGMCAGSALPIPVCESALALAQRFEKQVAAGKISITAVFPTSFDEASAGAALFRDVEGEFARHGISLVSDFPIERVTETTIESRLGRPITHDLLMLMPPFSGDKTLSGFSAALDESGFLRVDEHLVVDGAGGVYAAGDTVSISGPKFGYSAIKQGRIAALNILDELAGRGPSNIYDHVIPWVLGERHTGPVFFHYGVWDDTVEGFDEDALFGMARRIREHYGAIRKKALSLSVPA